VGQAQDDSESTVNVVKFVTCQQTVRLPESAGVYSANLFDQHSGLCALDLYFGPEGGRKGMSRRRCDDDGGQREQLVRLENDSVPPASLLMAPRGARRAKSEDFTPLHAGIPLSWRLFSSRPGLPD
jgi:hypothetical protein